MTPARYLRVFADLSLERIHYIHIAKNLTGEAIEIATALGESAQRLNTRVNNRLDMARLESGKVVLNRQWQPIEDLVGRALRKVQPILGRRLVQVALDDDLHTVLSELVLINLIENAVKYT